MDALALTLTLICDINIACNLEHFLCKVYFVTQIRCTVKFLKLTFLVSVHKEEESFVEQGQITALLPTPTMDNRNHFYFQTDVKAE